MGAGLGGRALALRFQKIATTARRQGENYVLSGTKAAVVGAPWADKLIVSARTSGGPRDRGGISLFVVDRHSANLHLQGFKTIDGRRAAEVTLMNVEVPASQLLGTEGEGVAALEACRDRAIAALCAEAVGAMTELNAATLEYSKTRKQFGATLGSFQVLQHRMVDMFIALEEAVSLTQHLNLSLAADEPNGSKLASGAKTKVGYAARFVAEQAVQLHGGMGMSDELNVGHYFKRITAINVQFGDPTYHLMRYARQNQLSFQRGNDRDPTRGKNDRSRNRLDGSHPIGKAYKGALNNTEGATLLGHAISSALSRAKIDPAEVEDVVMGCAMQQGTTGTNIARKALLRAGLPVTTAGTTIDRQCASGLQAIALAARSVITNTRTEPVR